MLISNNKKNLVLNSKIELNETDGKGKGHYFVSRFIEAGLAHYENLGDILITKETLDKFVQSMVGCPVIINHKDIDDKNVEKERVGVISRVWYNEADGWYYCEGVITDEQAVDLVKNQGWNVSCSYNFVSTKPKDKYHGKDYDMEFVDGEFLHLAIVETPRYEGANIVVNSAEDNFVTLTKKDGSKYKAFLFKPTKNIDSFSRYASYLIAEKAMHSKDKVLVEKCESILKEIKEETDYESKKNRSEQNINTVKKALKSVNVNVISTDDEGYKYEIIQGGGLGFTEEQAKKIKASISRHISFMNFNIEKDIDASQQKEKKENYYKIIGQIKKENNKANNNIGDITMTVLNDLKDFIMNVVNNEKEKDVEEKDVKNEKVDKRDIIRQIMAIAGKNEDNEDVKTIAKLAEKLAYDDSEAGTSDNCGKKAKNEDEEKEEKFEEEKEIANKEEDKKDAKVTENEEEDKKEAKNKCHNEEEDKKVDNSIQTTKEILFGGMPQLKQDYELLTRDERIELGNEY